MTNKIFLFPLALAVIFFASIIIIFSPVGKKNIIAFPTPTITPTPTPSTIIWQTYINPLDNYQISYPSNWISYPSNWKVTKEAERIILEKPDYTSISTYISIDSSNERGITLPIKTWINKSNNKLLNDPNRYIMSSPDTILSSDNILNIGITAVIIGNGFFGSGGKTYIFPYNNKIFEISTSYPIDRDNLSDTDIQKNISEIDQILSTFKFLPDTSTWKTYKNTEHGFEFKYPSSLSIRTKTTDSAGESTYLSDSKGEDVFMLDYIKNFSCPKEVCTPLTPQIFGDNTFIPLDTEEWEGKTYIYQNKYRIWINSGYSNQDMLTQIISSIKFTDNNISTKCTTDKDCSSTSFCDYNSPGGMGPNGFVAGEPYGSQKCILKCQSDDQCPSGQCQNFEIVIGDILDHVKGCKP